MTGGYAIPDIVLRELRERRAEWEVKPGGKHGKLVVNGIFCGVVSCGRGADDVRFARNLRSQVRRALRK